MATVERKRVTLHPLKEDGTVDPKICLYPKTFIDGIVDRNGNLVDVATAEELEEKANNNDVVHLNGDETINGNKTFTGETTFENNANLALEQSITALSIKITNPVTRYESKFTGSGLIASYKRGKIIGNTGYGEADIIYVPHHNENEDGETYTLHFPEKSGTIALASDISGCADKRNDKWDRVITKFTTTALTADVQESDGKKAIARLKNKVIFTNNTDHDLYLAFGHDYGREINSFKSEYNKDSDHNDTIGKQKYYPSRYDLVGQPKELNSAKCIAPGESVTLWDLLEPEHFYTDGALNKIGEIAQNIGLWSDSKVIAYCDQIRDFYESYCDRNAYTQEKWIGYMLKLKETSRFRNACDNFGFCVEVNNTTLKKLNTRIETAISNKRSRPKVVHALLGSRNATKKIYICERIKNKEDDDRAGYRCGKVYTALQLHIGTLAMTADKNADLEAVNRRFITFSFRPFFAEVYKKEPFNVYFKRTLGGPIKK